MEWGRSWVALIVSLLLASLVWILSNLSQTYSGTVSVPVMARCNLEGHQGLSSNTVLVSARCRTQGFRLVREQSRRERKTLVVDFSPADLHRTGPETFCVIGGAINSYVNQFFGEETTVEAFITDTLRFTFPLENHKKVPVEVPMTVHCRSQYMQSGPFHTTPDSVTVYGEDARLESIDKVTTSRLVLSDVHDTRSGILRLNPINGVRLSVDQVGYELPVTRYVELRSTLPVEVWNAPTGHELQVFPATAEVVLLCAFPLVKDPLPEFRIYVDYKDFAASINGRCVPRTLRLPTGVLEYRVQPEVFDCIESVR
jgi:hypothetical protein